MPPLRRPDHEPVAEWVRDIAADYEVSERTVWRWLAAGRASGEAVELDRACGYCDEPLPDEATIRRRYCDAACRVAAWRRPR